MYNSSKVAKAIRIAMLFGASAASVISTSSFAVDEGIEEVEKIQVTGSRITRTDLEAASPITVYSSADILASGATSLDTFIKQIPAMNGAQLGSNVNNASAGLATVSLRGLGAGRTLVLINGRRFNSGDLNSIPTSFIDRIEVVRDGASTIYGSDAIAGVINFITKNDFEGLDITGQYDVTGDGDGNIKKFSVVTGTSNAKGNVVFSIDYTDREAITQADRDFSVCPLWDDGVGSTTYCGGSGHSAYGLVNLPLGTPINGEIVGDKRPDDSTVGSSYVTLDGKGVSYNTADYGYNYASTSYLVTPVKIFSVNAASNYQVSNSIALFAEAGFSNRQSSQQMAPAATFWSAPVPAAHPDNIYGVDVSVNRRITEGGGRSFEQDTNDYRVVTGLQGEFDNDWGWDISYNYSRFIDARINKGELNRPNTETLLSPELCDADEECPGLWNPFAKDTMTDEQNTFATVTFSPVRKGTTTQFLANLTGDFGDIELPGGAILWAAGYERRTEYYLNEPDGAEALGQVYGQSGQRTEGGYSVDEIYAEFILPLFSGLAFAERLTVTAAVRASDYSNQEDTTTNTKFGLEWEPVDGLLARATFAEGLRAPSVTELYAPEEQSAIAYTDPCWEYGKSDNEILKANCTADGLPSDFDSDSQSNAIIGGNSALTPEESESITVGLVYSGIENFNMAFDYFDIKIEQGIGTAGVNNVASQCYNSVDFSNPLCELFKGTDYGPLDTPPHHTSPRRNVLGVLSGILVSDANLSTFETSGIDFDFLYNIDFANGSFTTSLNGTYVISYNYMITEGSETIEAAGMVAADQWEGSPAVFAKWRTNLGFSFATESYATNVTFRYQSSGDDINANETTLDSVADSVVYTDIQGTYYINDTYNVSVGARNLFDVKPPYLSNYDDANTINYSYDLAGQYLYVNATARF
ncbi:TonB-dependent receptor plug domain-containing protein [Colwellia echini]|uniref:TonB-dependent receptor n=1 Tax=Colwellia echini TaxID=1982103 RepID=A0ABY3MYY7_9GAMM|nr:TonB-dependent receptor [Colwellia echini]TYK66422.1 TonB-dependent receptor [Colwellia echini]